MTASLNKMLMRAATVVQNLYVLLRLLVISAIILSFKFYCKFYCMFYFTYDRCFTQLPSRIILIIEDIGHGHLGRCRTSYFYVSLKINVVGIEIRLAARRSRLYCS